MQPTPVVLLAGVVLRAEKKRCDEDCGFRSFLADPESGELE
jgi:hypothetical protein